MSAFWKELETLAASAASTTAQALLSAYLNKATGAPGAPAMTLENVGRISGTVAAATALQHIAARPAEQPAVAQPAADPAAQAPAAPVSQPDPAPATTPAA